MTVSLALALGLLVSDCGPDLRLAAAEAARAVSASPSRPEVLVRGPEPERRWFSPLSQPETIAQLAVVGLGLVDWGQTIRFTQGHAFPAYEESNPVLGRHPSRLAVNAYFPLALGLHTLCVWALPSPYRNVLQIGGVVVEGVSVGSNVALGIAPAAPWR